MSFMKQIGALIGDDFFINFVICFLGLLMVALSGVVCVLTSWIFLVVSVGAGVTLNTIASGWLI